MLRAQVKEMEFIYGSLYRFALSLFATSTDMGNMFFLFFFSGDNCRAGKRNVKNPSYFGMHCSRFTLCIWKQLDNMDISQPIANRK